MSADIHPGKYMKKILIVDDEPLIRWSLSQPLTKDGYLVESAASGTEAQAKLDSFRPEMVLLDIRLPDANGLKLLESFKREHPDLIIIMITAYADVGSTVEAFKLGAEDYIGKPFNLDSVRQVIKLAFEKRKLSSRIDQTEVAANQQISEDRLIGNSPEMIDVFKIIKRCAETNDKTVLILGESGTGKELVAQAVHFYSRRSRNPFFEINCAAIPENLLENELFGHEKGAYTDAGRRHKGIFELADGGTVFLDEIGDMPLAMQGKILKAIENKRYRRLGGDRDIAVNVRVIAATNRDLEKMVREGGFRADLFYRLNVMTIRVPPLRERPADIPHLAHHFIEIFNQEHNRSIEEISPEALEKLLAYPWPGNVRELRNTIERAIILEDSRVLSPDNLDLAPDGGKPCWSTPVTTPPPRSEPRPDETASPGQTRIAASAGETGEIVITLPAEGVSLDELEKSIIQLALEKHAGNQTRAARYLHLSRDTLRYRMKKFDLK